MVAFLHYLQKKLNIIRDDHFYFGSYYVYKSALPQAIYNNNLWCYEKTADILKWFRNKNFVTTHFRYCVLKIPLATLKRESIKLKLKYIFL